ncbi:MAG: T9SS type A sorting domain-containing protein [Saprospiraceae bacterium]
MQKQSPFWLKLLSLLLFFVGTQSAQAQVYPGDANNDGTVNHFDILYIGYAYGSVGPLRPDTTVDYTEAAAPLLWTRLFPDGVNFAYADTDGNGLVDFGDFLTVYRNFGSKRLNPQPIIPMSGAAGFDPQLRLGDLLRGQAFTEGAIFEIPVFLEGPRGSSIRSVNGIAFSLEYDPQIFKAVTLELDSSWLGLSSDLFSFQIPSNNRLDVALTRFGRNPVQGSGKIAKLRGVIEDDLIALLTRDSIQTRIRAQYIKMVDGNFQDVATAGSEAAIIIYDSARAVHTDEVPLSQLIQIFPNPTSDILHIKSAVAIQQVEILNLQGQRLGYRQLDKAYSLGLSFYEEAPGIIIIKIYTERGIMIQKVIIR